MSAYKPPHAPGRYVAPPERPYATLAARSTEPQRLTVRRVYIDAQGYDAGGAYWGLGPKLWVALDDDGATAYFRAPTLAAAKLHALTEFADI